MKIKIVFTTIFSIMILAAVAFSGCDKSSPTHVQQLNNTESTEITDNPDQGFYHTLPVTVKDDGVTYANYVVTDSTRLYHLRLDISAFSSAAGGEDKPLSQPALDGFTGLLDYLKSKDKNAIVRFAYDPSFGGAANMEPSLETMLGHIAQVCPIINRYESTVTAVEVGLVGPWGEMHTSAAASSENIKRLTAAFLENTNSVPVLVRTPKMIYNYLGITLGEIDGYTVPSGSLAYRLGLFNDGYLGSSTDLGTYTDREREVKFLSGQTAHLPYGGEVVVPTSELHDIDKCLPEMFELNLSYLNAEWNGSVITKWKNSTYTEACGDDADYYGKTAFEYIRNRLGYRFVLKNSVFVYPESADSLEIELTLKNVGFGNLNKSKKAKIIVTDRAGSVVCEKQVDDFTGGESYSVSLGLELSAGEYDVYLRLYGDEYDGTPLYCLQFANYGIWDAELKANLVGMLSVTE